MKTALITVGSTREYIDPVRYITNESSGQQGMALVKSLIKNNFKVVDEIIFPDHYQYKKEDINKIKLKAKKLNAKIITTEKDYVKISKKDTDNIDFLEIDLKIKNERNLINLINLMVNEKY